MIINILKKALVVVAIVLLVMITLWVTLKLWTVVAPMCTKIAEPLAEWIRTIPGFETFNL